MAGMAHAPRTHPREPLILGIVLIGIGLGAFVANVVPDTGAWITLLIGLGLLAVFAFTRAYGALVPAGIMTGLGAGILLSTQLALEGEATGGVIVTGLGLGFVSIWVIGALAHVEEHHPWPLIPGGILTIVGVALLIGGQAIELLRYWPIVLIAIGVVAIGRALRDASAD